MCGAWHVKLLALSRAVFLLAEMRRFPGKPRGERMHAENALQSKAAHLICFHQGTGDRNGMNEQGLRLCVS